MPFREGGFPQEKKEDEQRKFQELDRVSKRRGRDPGDFGAIIEKIYEDEDGNAVVRIQTIYGEKEVWRLDEIKHSDSPKNTEEK